MQFQEVKDWLITSQGWVSTPMSAHKVECGRWGYLHTGGQHVLSFDGTVILRFHTFRGLANSVAVPGSKATGRPDATWAEYFGWKLPSEEEVALARLADKGWVASPYGAYGKIYAKGRVSVYPNGVKPPEIGKEPYDIIHWGPLASPLNNCWQFRVTGVGGEQAVVLAQSDSFLGLMAETAITFPVHKHVGLDVYALEFPSK
jgi:hypothetical protein